ncbi:MAG: hypothetical protein U0353_13800 [Sandaracinus sp.]
MITPRRFAAMCLALEGTTSAPHFDRTAYRARKIFATVPPDGRSANLLLVPDLQSAVVDAMPHAFQPVPGGWGRMGYTTVDLTKATETELAPVLRESHALASEPAKRKPSKSEARPAKPSKNGAKPSTAIAKPSKRDARPSTAATKPSKGDAKPSTAAAKPSKGDAKPSKTTGTTSRSPRTTRAR